MTAPNPVRMLPSHGVEDQTDPDSEWSKRWQCRGSDLDPVEHHMISVKTGSPKVPYVERCATCGFIDATSLEWWADNAVKLSLADRAKRIAVSAETEPFAFVQSVDGPEPDLAEILAQALGAASMCWVDGAPAREFDSTRARTIWVALAGEVGRFQRLALEDAATRAVNLVEANHAYTSQESRLAALRKAIEESE